MSEQEDEKFKKTLAVGSSLYLVGIGLSLLSCIIFGCLILTAMSSH